VNCFCLIECRNRRELPPVAAAIAIVVDPAMAMTAPDVRAAYNTANHTAHDGTGRSGNDHAAARANSDAFPRSGLRGEWHGGQCYSD
jgi:hypothetical protein